MTNSEGVIEYVNPSLELVTGYSLQELAGQSQSILKSEQQAPLLYRELWETIRNGDDSRSIVVNRKKNVNSTTRRRA